MPLRQLVPDAGSADTAKVDIIVVHGLNPRSKGDAAHAWDTWRTPAGPDGRLWLRDDLPQHLPDARVFLYEYNATAVYGRDRDTFVGKANELLEAIRIERDDVEARPILFFGHSMGGLLVKQALINAHNNKKYISIKGATRGLAFFATPHNGGDSKLVSLGKLTSKIATKAGFQKGDDVLEVLKSGSMFSDLMQEHWRHQLLEYDIVSFWGGLDNIVPRESARLGLPGDRENVVKLNADHSGVCKFGTEQTDQDNLKLARANIKDLYRAALKTVEMASLPSAVGQDALGPEDQLAQRFARLQADRDPPRGSNGPKLPQYHLPLARNRKFTGRSSIIEEIQQKLFIEQECQKLAIVGLGGVGKTQVALQLAYWVKEKHPDYSILWVPVLSYDSFEQAYLEIGKKLGVLMNIDEEDPKESVRRYLSSDEAGRWLLIVDNADDIEMVLGSNDGTEGIDQYLPESEKGLTLFTTRSTVVGQSVAGSDVIELDEMDPTEAMGLLEKSLRRKQLIENSAHAAELLQELTYLPLAITQAAAYLNCNKQLSVQGYLKLLHGTEKDMVGLMSKEFQDATRYQGSSNAVATTWIVSFDQIQNIDNTAADLLSFLSCIEPKAIPRSLLPDTESAETENAIGTLCGYAFLTVREDAELYDMHSLVHLATKVWIRKAARTEETTVQALRHFEATFPSSDRANRLVWQAYLPHAFRLLDGSGECRVNERFKLFYQLGMCLDKDRRFKDVVRCYKEVVRWRMATLPKTDTDRLASEHALASAYLDDRRIPEAIEIFEHVVAVRKETLDESDHNRLTSEHALASAYLDDRRILEAIEIFEHVVVIRKETLDVRDHNRLESEHELARAYLNDRRIPWAIQILKHVVTVRKETLDKRDHDRLESEHALASAYLNDRQISEAIEMLKHIVAVRKETLNERDHDRLESEHTLASAYLNDRQIPEAIEMLEHVVAVVKETLDERDHERLASEHELARAYLSARQITKAIEVFEHVVAIWKETLNERDHDRLTSEQALAVAYLDDRRIPEAIEMLEHVVAVRKETLDERDHDRLASEHELARAYLSDKRIPEAIDLLEHVVAIKEDSLREDDPDRMVSKDLLEEAYEMISDGSPGSSS